MPRVLYERDGRIGRITLNRPEVMNAIDNELPVELADCVARANADENVHVIVLSGAGRGFCAGYDLKYYAEAAGSASGTQEMPWDPMKDYAFMMRNTELFMSLWRSYRPVICKVHGYAVAGGSDIAPVLRPDRHGRGCAHRIHAGAGLGLSDDGNVGVPTRPATREADAVHGGQDRRPGGRANRPGPQGGAGPSNSMPRSRRWRSGSLRCRSTSS